MRLLELKAPWLASCMTFNPIPAKPKPMMISVIQNPQLVPVAPKVMRPHGTKNAASIRAVFRVHAPISLAGFSSFLEIRVNALFKGFAEVGLGPIEANNWNLHG